MSLRIAVVTAFPEDSSRPRGGVEAVSVNLVAALARLGDLEVHVVTTDEGRKEPASVPWGEVAVHRLPVLGRTTLGGAVGPGRRQMHAFLRALAPDVVHAHDVYGLMVKGLPLPRVFTVHGFIHGDTLVSGGRQPWLRSQIWRLVETAGWADQPHIISISPYVRERLHGIARGVIHDVENPVSEELFTIERCETEGTVFCAALICRRKNTLGLVDALARVRALGLDAHLRLAGPVSEPDYGRQVDARIRALGLDDRVTLLGRVSSADVRRELSRASVFALISLEENSPMGIEEAMAVGVPVLTSNRCGMPYMVRHGETGFLVDPLDPDDVSEHLAALLGNSARRRAMGEQARRLAKERFHPDAVAVRTREVYRRAVARRRAG